ncbi:MAG: hypothetical protein V1784_02835 [bacterium]
MSWEGADWDRAYGPIRALLAGLPHIQAPVGFDFRLRERIARLESPQRRIRLEWSVPAWRGLSVGLGIATAVIVGLLFFRPRPVELPIAASTQAVQDVPVPLANSFPMASPAQEDTQMDRSITGSPERESGDEMLASQAKPDSLERSFHPPSGYFQSVGGNPSVRGK